MSLMSLPGASVANAMIFEAHQLKVNRLCLDKESNQLKYIHFTDLHYTGENPLTRRVVEEFYLLKPDFACFTGDLIGRKEYKKGAFAFIRSLGCPVFGVPGNHDYWCGVPFDEYERAFAETGGAWLEDKSILAADRRVEIVGISGMSIRSIERKRASHRILLTHYPLTFDEVDANMFTIVLAGHSHGGQIRIPYYGPLYLPQGVGKYDLGQFATAVGVINVSAGLGTSLLPIRFNCQPDITLITA